MELEQPPHILTALVRKARLGDGHALSGLYRQYNTAMFNICIRMTGNRSDAEDLLQEAFLLAFGKLYQLKEEHLFGGWLRKIVVTECIRFTRQHFYWSEFTEQVEEQAEDTGADWWSSVSFEAMQQEIRLLPNGCRQVFTLYVLEDFSHRQIAEQIGISESTSKSQYQRARQLLKERLIQKMVTNGSL